MPHIYGSTDYGKGGRLVHWSPTSGLVAVNPFEKWGRAAGPLCRLGDGRIFVYDAGLYHDEGVVEHSIGYTLNAELEDFQPWPAYPVTPGYTTDEYDRLTAAHKASVYYRPETDTIWVCTWLFHRERISTPPRHVYYEEQRYRTSRFMYHEFDRDGNDLRHAADEHRLDTWFDDPEHSGVYLNGWFYHMDWSWQFVRYNPATGSWQMALIDTQETMRYQRILGNATFGDKLLIQTWSYELQVEGVAIVDPEDFTWREARYQWGDSYPPVSHPPATYVRTRHKDASGQWAGAPWFEWYPQDCSGGGHMLYYTSYVREGGFWDYEATDEENYDNPSDTAVIAVDLNSREEPKWHVAYRFPWVIDKTLDQWGNPYWATTLNSLIVLDDAGTGLGEKVGDRQAFLDR